jgi:hypothetical protein
MRQILKAQNFSSQGTFEALSIGVDKPLDRFLDTIQNQGAWPGVIATRGSPWSPMLSSTGRAIRLEGAEGTEGGTPSQLPARANEITSFLDINSRV